MMQLIRVHLEQSLMPAAEQSLLSWYFQNQRYLFAMALWYGDIATQLVMEVLLLTGPRRITSSTQED
jgi:hypothetical protein